MRIQLPFAVLAATFVCSPFSAPAHAQRARTFVASYGNDSNPCTCRSPCKTFQQAVNVVAVGGEVTAIDSAGFGPVNITQSVTITSPPGVEAGIVPTSGGDAITISNTVPANITLRGLTLEGSGVGLRGIHVTSSLPYLPVLEETINIVACVVKDFTDSGILVQPTSSGFGTAPFMRVVIADSLVTGNGADGIKLAPGQVNFGAFIYRTIVDSNSGSIDISVDTGGTAFAELNDSNVDNNARAFR